MLNVGTPIEAERYRMHRGIPKDPREARCPRCGGHPNGAQLTTRSERPCTCWDPLVEWLMDRTDKPR